MNNKVAVKVENLTKIYKGNIIGNKDITIDIYEGEIFGLLGPNAAGKTTFVKQILGLLTPTSGSIYVYDVDVIKYPDKIKSFVNYLGQSPYALWHLTIEEAIYYTGYLKGLAKKEAKYRMQRLIEELNLIDYRKVLLGELSGGILRLTNFCMSIISDCKLLILDEPTAGLDPVNKRDVWNKIIELNKENNITCILVTHDVLEAEKVLERVGFINHAKIIALGTVGELKREVDEKLRIELRLKPDCKLEPNEVESINRIGELVEVYPNHFIVFPKREAIAKSIDQITNILKFDIIDDMRLVTPTLEDVYIKLCKEKVE